MQKWFLPAILIIFGLISTLILTSIAPELAARQFIFFCLGFLIFFAISNFDFSQIVRKSPLLYGSLIILLIIPLMIQERTRGAARWIDVGDFFAIQPSQLAIPFVGLFLSWYATKNDLSKIKNLVKFFFLMLVPGLLIFIGPDLGTTLVYVLSIAAILLFSEVKWQYFLGISIVGLVSVIFIWSFLLQPYQKQRITSFMDSGAIEANYNARQSLIAVGAGQISGSGVGKGIQSHLRFLPERQTDFIFASFAEEFGFIGAILILSLYFGMSAFLILATFRTNDKTALFFLIAVTSSIWIQTSINIGMNVGLLPITGLTLPFLSYGGSSILSLFLMLAIVQSEINSRNPKPIMHIE